MGVPVELDGTPSRELKQLYVEAPYHGRGVSHQLIEHYFDWARSEGAVDHYVSCWSENHRALRFYAKYGFEVVGSYTFYVGDHQDDERILKSTGYRSISEASIHAEFSIGLFRFGIDSRVHRISTNKKSRSSDYERLVWL